MANYPHSEIEPKWQRYWDDNNTNKTIEDFSKPKYYILDMFPYPSGAGLHIGHPEGYTASDIITRYKKAKGFSVLHPMGFDAFGLPTERYSMQTGIHPEIATEKNIENFRRQLKLLGFSYDWSREVNTTSPNYYKWTQWMFLKIYNSFFDENLQKARPIDELPIPSYLNGEKDIEEYKDQNRLAYISEIPVNWCEELGTVLANEEVDEWREKGYTVERRPMKQWMIRITKYAQRLLDDLEMVDWPSSTMEMQKNWIGRSEGAEVDFGIDGSEKKIRIYTTRPDTIFGATYMVLAPEHPFVKEVTTAENLEKVVSYIESASMKTDLERTELVKNKTGIFTGGYAINPATGGKIQIWIADYVLGHYGTGAIMAVPAHDERDHEFAKMFNLPIVQVVTPASGEEIDVQIESFCTYDGKGMNSENSEVSLNDLPYYEAKKAIINWLETKGIGVGKVQFRLRDWLFSRQRYWGEPIPVMFFEDGTKRALDEDELPLTLPYVSDFQPAGTGESPLAKVPEWVDFIDKKTGKRAKLETNTMPQWAGSCWYYLRYIDPQNNDIFAAEDKENFWMGNGGIDLYIGGAEHAVLHLLYARFWHKVLFDYNLVSTPEPFKKLFHQGLILAFSYRNKNNVLIPNDMVREDNGKFFHTQTGEELEEIVAKMSKSLKNVVNPDKVVEEYGADSLRLFEMFLGPLEQSKPWSKTGIEGVFRFLNKVWRMYLDDEGNFSPKIQDTHLNAEQEFMLHSTVKKVGDDIEKLRFNTAISQMMIFANEFARYDVFPTEAASKFIRCLAPFAPHLAEEIWQKMGNSNSITFAEFPDFDDSKTVQNSIEFVVQVNSKIRGKVAGSLGAAQSDIEPIARENENVVKFLEGLTIRKVIFVKDKLINFIAN
ncbi:MAG: leucine--tRNA ligase [Ignavibacteria bacterium GWF2_33_9]|nr:MAG: leucine--tRNA ligase [Ignavibacteria bacterium GWF2_33_9]